MGHLLLNVEVGSGAGALHNHAGVNAGGHFNGQTFIGRHTHGIAQVNGAFANQFGALFRVKHARWLGWVVHHAYDQFAEQRNSLFDDIQMTQMEWVKTAGVKRNGHNDSYANRCKNDTYALP